MRILYVIPYTVPLVAYAILLHGVFHGVAPTGALFWIFPALGALSLAAGFSWTVAKGNVPVWLDAPLCLVAGVRGLLDLLYRRRPLAADRCGMRQPLVMMAVLLLGIFRRFSPGVILSAVGFGAWSLSILEIFPAINNNPVIDINLTLRVMVLGKVVGAVGLILLALEDQLALNQTAQERERRARRELEAYTNLILSRRRVEDFDRQAEGDLRDGDDAQPVCAGCAVFADHRTVPAGRRGRS